MKKISVLFMLITMILCCSACGDKIVLETASDLANLRVGAVKTTYGEIYVKDCSFENIVLFENIDDAANAIAGNEIDCVITDLNTAKTIASAREDITTTQTRIIENIDYYAAVRAGDFDTRSVAEVVTAEIKKETDFSKLCRGMIETTGEERESFITEPQVGSSGEFTLGVLEQNSPYVFEASNGEMNGIEIEYAKRFAEKRDQTLEVKVYEKRSDLINALKSGEIDLYFRQAPLPASSGVTYSSSCYTVELRVLIADK